MFGLFRCKPIYKKKVWGGRWLADVLGRQLPDLDPYGESWELSCRSDAMSQVLDGPHQGKTLSKLISEYPLELLGKRVVQNGIDPFPLLIKFIDASDHLSIQVHPDDHYAQQKMTGDLGKNEMWYVLDAEEGATLILGLKEGVNRSKFAKCIQDEGVQHCFHQIQVKTGDALYIPAGTVHAILKGIRLAEIQQNSDTTYRIYDWERLGFDGKPRELHVDEALEVIDYERGGINPFEGIVIEEMGCRRRFLVACSQFAVEEVEIGIMKGNITEKRFEVWMILEGEADVFTSYGSQQFKKGETWMIPAALGEFEINGHIKLLKIYIPDIENEIKLPLLEHGIKEEDLKKIGGLS